jgi:hypothetical protein
MKFFRRRRACEEFQQEIRTHLEIETQQNVAAGMSPHEARYAARRAFGSITLLEEAYREMWGISSLERLWHDLRYALRMLRKSPGFTAVAVLSLALGVGVNTAIFSLIDALSFRRLPVRNPEQLVLLGRVNPRGDGETFSYPQLEWFRQHNEVLSDMLAFSYRSRIKLAAGDEPQAAALQFVSAGYFQALGVGAQTGRALQAADERASVAVISDAYWKGDSAATGPW